MLDPVAVTLSVLSLLLELVNLLVGSDWRLAFRRLTCRSVTADPAAGSEQPARPTVQLTARGIGGQGGGGGGTAGYEPLIRPPGRARASRRSLVASASLRCQALTTLLVLLARASLKVVLVFVTYTGTTNTRLAYFGTGVALEALASLGLHRLLGGYCGPLGRLVNLALGVTAGNTYTQSGARKTAWSTVLGYSTLWVALILIKFLVDFFLV